MSPLVQTIVAALLVACALAWLALRAWRSTAAARAREGSACGTGCGCDGPPPGARSAS